MRVTYVVPADLSALPPAIANDGVHLYYPNPDAKIGGLVGSVTVVGNLSAGKQDRCIVVVDSHEAAHKLIASTSGVTVLEQIAEAGAAKVAPVVERAVKADIVKALGDMKVSTTEYQMAGGIDHEVEKTAEDVPVVKVV